MDIKTAMRVLTEELRTDPGYYMSWQANIAVQFQDEYKKYHDSKYILVTLAKLDLLPHFHSQDDIHKVSNKAADNFLKMLLYVSKP